MATVTAERDGNGALQQKRWKQGGYKTLPFIMANEICDKFATAGFNANLISYLTQQLNMTLVDASNTLTNFGGTTSLTVVLGAFFADSYIGRFWSIVAGSIFYQMGIMGLVLSAVVPSLRPPPCHAPDPGACQRPSSGHLAVLYISMLCMCLGTGGIRPSVVAFGADQFDQQSAEAWANRKRRYFNVYFFTMGSATLLALTLVVYIQDNVGWGWGFGIPAISMFVSIVVFVVAYPRSTSGPSPGAARSRGSRRSSPPRSGSAAPPCRRTQTCCTRTRSSMPISTKGRLLHTDKLKFLDRAAIVTPAEAVAPVDGAPRGGAQVRRPLAAHLVGRHHPRRSRLAQRLLHHHAGAHHGAPHHPEPGDPAGDPVHLHHRDNAREHHPLRPRVRAPGAARHGPAVRGHLLPADGHRANHRHLRRRRHRARRD